MEPTVREWAGTDHVEGYLAWIDEHPWQKEGEATLLDTLPPALGRFLDLGAGDGRLTAIVLEARPEAQAVCLDMSPPMLEAAHRRFSGDQRVMIIHHDLEDPLPELGTFDAVVSCFAIHHCPDERKQSLYGECFERLKPDGVLLNLEHIASPSDRLRDAFLAACGMTIEDEDESNILLDPWTQLQWLEEIGFCDVDCLWKWREFALLSGVKPRGSVATS